MTGITRFNMEFKGEQHSLIINFPEICWGCGTSNNITKAHVIPQSSNPKRNLIIPMCKPCHEKLDGFRNPNKGIVDKINNLENTLKQIKDKIQVT